jgi:hypothetical protein
MFIAYAVVAVLLSLLLLASARAKLTRDPKIVESLTGLGVPLGMFAFLAGAEIAGAVGLVVGLWIAPLGIAAAIGVVAYFIGAVLTHLRRSDFKGVPTPLVILIASGAVLALRATSM